MSFKLDALVTRRSLIRQLSLAACSLLLFFSPTLEAAVIHEQLRRTLKAPLTPSKLQRAALLIHRVQTIDVHLDPNFVSQLGSKVLDVAAEQPSLALSAMKTTAAFASYRTYLTPSPATNQVSVIRVTTEGFNADLVSIGPTMSQGGALWVSAEHGTQSICPPVQRVIVKVFQETEGIVVDFCNIRSVTFENATIRYSGDTIRLESVQFIKM
jgi:hypothetical protein